MTREGALILLCIAALYAAVQVSEYSRQTCSFDCTFANPSDPFERVGDAERLQPPPAVCSIKDMQDGDGGPVTITAVDERGWYAEAGDGRFKLFANSDMGLIGMLCGWLREEAAP